MSIQFFHRFGLAVLENVVFRFEVFGHNVKFQIKF